MAYTTAQLQALQNALAQGTLRVTFEGRSIEYRSVTELSAAIDTVQNALAAAGGTRVRQYRMGSSKGF